jgi:uncharacterized membrane protein YqjE
MATTPVTEGSAAPTTELPAVTDEHAAGFASMVQSLLSAWRRLAHARLSLFALELKRAGLGLGGMLGMALVAAFLLMTSWVLLLALIGYWAVELGMDWGGAGLVLLAINVVLAGALIWGVVRTAEHLTFAATRRALGK